MEKLKKVISLLFAVVMISTVLISFFMTGSAVESATEATEISQRYINRRFGDKYSECVASSVYLENDIWVVAYRDLSPDLYAADGGAPVVYIKEDNHKMIWCKFQK